MIKQGDIYEIKLRDGRFGAAKVLKTGGKFDFSTFDFHLIAITTYIDNEPPTIDDIRLKEILTTAYIYPRGFKVIKIYCGNFPKNCRYIGNVPVTVEENKLKIEIGDGTNGGFLSCGKIGEHIGNEVLIEWRYKFDNTAFMLEAEKSRQEAAKAMMELRNAGPKKMLDDKTFWQMISLLDWNKQGHDDEVLAPAIKGLAKLKASEIKNFEETLAYKLHQLDRKDVAKNIGEYAYKEGGHLSADMFLYARCAVVANGKACYEMVMNDSSKMLKDIDFEPLLSLAASAYELKTNKDWNYETGISYETGANLKEWE